MCCTKRLSLHVYLLLIIVAAFLEGCTNGVISGNLSSQFAGVQTATAISPTAVKLTWYRATGDIDYSIYSSGSTQAIQTVTFDYAIVENLTPNTDYTFKVVARTESGNLGTEKEIKVTTWPRFTGINSLTKDENGNFIAKWDYNYPVKAFYVFYGVEVIPDATNTSNWASPNVTVLDQTTTVKNLLGSANYYFVVHAVYREGEIERSTAYRSSRASSSFPAEPKVKIDEVTIGALPAVTVEVTTNDTFKEQNYSSQLYRGTTPISDPRTGNATLVVLPSVNLKLGLVDNLNVHVTYPVNGVNETFIQTVDINNKPLQTYLKDQSKTLDKIPVNFASAGPGFLGKAMAVGDFNCDGADDLAIGMPDSTIASIGMQNSNQGAVYIYYSKNIGGKSVLYTPQNGAPAPVLEPVNASDPQIIAVTDLNKDARFGASLSVGNLNGDKSGGYSCDDLIVGAPGAYSSTNSSTYTGSAFVYFGSSSGIRAPKTLPSITENAETCDGNLTGATCNVVRLWPDDNIYLSGTSNTGFQRTIGDFGDGGKIRFGASVAFIGDINGDGYDDIAVGAPDGAWDGQVGGGSVPVYMNHAGFVTIYFGSKYGLGKEQVSTTESTQTTRAIKLFAPMPHANMNFGESVAGGVDVDGADGPANAVNSTSDFVIGAPNAGYIASANAAGTTPSWSSKYIAPLTGSGSSVSNFTYGFAPGSAGAAGNGWGNTDFFGFKTNYDQSASAIVATGAAYLYFGMTSADGTKAGYYACQNREPNDPTTAKHYSCFTNGNNIRALFPREWSTSVATSEKFGSAVAMAGSKYLKTNVSSVWTPIATSEYSDPNGDGYGEIFVAATEGGTSTKPKTGVVWEYFGNAKREYDAEQVYSYLNSHALSTTTRTNYYTTVPGCTSFDNSVGTDTTKSFNCRPVLIKTNSFNTGAQLGLSQAAITTKDISGDGLKDLIVGAPYDSSVGVNAGAAFVFTSISGQGIGSSYYKITKSGSTGFQLGYSVAAGNFDFDFNGAIARNDLALGAPNDNNSGTHSGSGAAHLYLTNGSNFPSTTSTAAASIFDSNASYQFMQYGDSKIVGDINMDGYDDAVAPFIYFDTNGKKITDAIVYFGSSAGLVTTSFCLDNPDLVFTGTPDLTECYPKVTHNSSNLQAGIVLPQKIARPSTAVETWALYGYAAGDVNGDTFADVVFLDPDTSGSCTASGSNYTCTTGNMVIYYGSAGGLRSVNNPAWVPISNGDPQLVSGQMIVRGDKDFNYASEQELSNFSRNIIKYGDFNGDGYSDVVIADPFASAPNVTSTTGVSKWDCGTDLDNQQCNSGGTWEGFGRVFIIYGSASGLQTPRLKNTSLYDFMPMPSDSYEKKDGSTILVKQIYGSDETNLNSYDSTVTLNNPYPGIDNTHPGKACYSGLSGNTCDIQVVWNPLKIEDLKNNPNFTYGYKKLQQFFGTSIEVIRSQVGVDNLVISAPLFEDLSCIDPGTYYNYGRAYVYYGTLVNGLGALYKDKYYEALSTGTCWDVNSDVLKVRSDAYNNNRVHVIEPKKTGIPSQDNERRFGLRMTVAGDINGDNVEDLVVATSNQGDGVSKTGTAYVYYGPLCSNDNQVDFQASVNSLTTALAGANPDCIVVGGSKLTAHMFRVIGAGDDKFGISLAGGRSGKSDFNKDGYSDILIGTPLTSDTVRSLTNLGRGVVFFGSSKGLVVTDSPVPYIAETSASTVSARLIKPFMITPNPNVSNSVSLNKANFFRGGLSVGDVNNDGAMDFMIPSQVYDGEGSQSGVDLGAFLLFY